MKNLSNKNRKISICVVSKEKKAWKRSRGL